MSCCICGEARGCLACTVGRRIAHLVATDPAYRDQVEERWREESGKPATPREDSGEATRAIDPIALAIDLCPHRRSCQCREPIACGHPERAGPKTLAQCRACRADAAR